MKSHRSHDIVLLCIDCHMLAHTAAEHLKRAFAIRYSVPLYPVSHRSAQNSAATPVDDPSHGKSGSSSSSHSGMQKQQANGTDLKVPAPNTMHRVNSRVSCIARDSASADTPLPEPSGLERSESRAALAAVPPWQLGGEEIAQRRSRADLQAMARAPDSHERNSPPLAAAAGARSASSLSHSSSSSAASMADRGTAGAEQRSSQLSNVATSTFAQSALDPARSSGNLPAAAEAVVVSPLEARKAALVLERDGAKLPAQRRQVLERTILMCAPLSSLPWVSIC